MRSTTSTEARNGQSASSVRLSRRTAMRATAGGVASVMAAGQLPRSLAARAQDDPEGGVVLTLPVYPHGQQLILDPHRATNWGPHWVILPHVWAGLLGFDENGAVVPVLARSVEPEQDGLVWVATIAPDATFASGNPVTAQAMIDGWRRAIRPQRPAPLSHYMRRVAGFDDYLAGESEEIGFEVRDERTVAITLSEPYALFREDLATFVWAAVDVEALENVPDSQTAFANASAGRWRFVDSGADGTIRMEPNENATGLPESFSAVVWRSMEGPQAVEAGIEAYRNGEIPVADVTPLILDSSAGEGLEADLQSVSSPGSTMLIGMDYNQAPFDNPDVRRAIARAIDRERWASEIMGGTFMPAESITPPVLAETAGYQAPDSLAFDPDAARQLLQDAGITEDTMPQVTLYQPAESPESEIEQVAALIAMIQQNSGLVIAHDTTLTAEQIDALRNDNGGLQLAVRWWWPLTSSPSGLADLALPASSSMDGWFNWSEDAESAEVAEAARTFTESIQQAQATMDDDARNQLFAQAEEILLQNAVFVPLGYWVQRFVQSSSLAGTRQGAFTGYVPLVLDEAVTFTPTTSTPTG